MEQIVATCLEMIQQRGYELLETNETNILARKRGGDLFAVLMIGIDKFNVGSLTECSKMMQEMGCYHVLVLYSISCTHAVRKSIDQLSSISVDGKNKRIELFKEEDLKYNITKHSLQPKSFEKLIDIDPRELVLNLGDEFEKVALSKVKGKVLKVVSDQGRRIRDVSKEELLEIKKMCFSIAIQDEFKRRWPKVPILKTTDPIARFLDFSKGEIIRIVRRDDSVHYRKVI